MATLNEIAYNIKELMSGGDEKLENNIDTRQIKYWVHYHRAKIIEEKLKSRQPIDRRYIQPIASERIEYSEKEELYGNQSSLSSSVVDSYGFALNDYNGVDWNEGKQFNTFSKHLAIPSTINVGNIDGVTDIRLRKRVIGSSGGSSAFGRWTGWKKLTVKSKDDVKFAWANKFTKTSEPYALLYTDLNNLNLEISGLRYQVVENDNTNIYDYWVDVWGILTDPTQAKKVDSVSGGVTTYEDFNDSSSYYPIAEEDIPLLNSRVAEVEMNLVLKTPNDLVEDNVDTTKIKIGSDKDKKKKKKKS